ncbi:MAG: tetratricopeptide repeat protein, partial [Pirellulaceae bacterium]|nr:tetratricopeptide repeat protein [Pirellulaceae bacterium]
MSEYRLPLNVRLLAILIGSSLLLLILVLIVHRFQVKGQAGFFLEQARIAKDAADRFEDTDAKLEEITKAAANYAKYLNQNPDDADVRAEYGLMLLDHAEKLARNQMVREAGPLFGESVIHLERVLRDEPDRQKLRRKLVRSLSLLGSGSEALQHLAILAAVPNDPDGLQALFDRYELWTRGQPDQVDRGSEWRKEVLAKFLSADGNTVDRDRVVKWLQDDLWMVLDDQELLLDFARCQIQLSRPESAEKPLQKAIQLVEDKGQTDLVLYSLLASLLHELRRPNDAEYWISEAVNRNPDSFDANRIRGQYRVDLVRRSPKETAVVLAQGALWDATESIRKAIEQALDKADAATPPVEATSLKTAFNAARAARSRGREEVTPAYRDRLIEAAKGLIALKPALPDTTKECDAVRNGLLLAASAELAAARLEETPADSPTLLGAEAFATAARELFPDHGPAYLVLADIDSLRGREPAAIEWLRQGRAVGENRLMLTWRLTMHLIRSGDLAEARTLIGELAEANAPEVVLLHLNALVAYSEKNWAEAKKGFDSVLPHLGDQPESAFEVNLLLADCCAKLGLVDQQREALENAAKLDWTSIRALLDLADVEMRSGQLDEAIEDYRRALRLPGAPPAAHLALTRAILAKTARLPKSERNWIEVDTALDEAKKALPDSPLVAILHA